MIHSGVTPNDDSLEDQKCVRQRVRRLLNIPANALFVDNIGWLIPRKRFDVFLQVASRIYKVRPEDVFVICSGGSLEEELRRMAAELGIADAVRFEGWVQDLEPFYQAFDVLFFNSGYDASGLTALEAANHGATVVASVRYGGPGEFIEHGASASIRNNASEMIQREYDISVSAAQHERLFNSC